MQAEIMHAVPAILTLASDTAPVAGEVVAGAAAPVAKFGPEAFIALATLTVMEIVLGIDNIVFIAILCARLPESQREKARVVGLSLAMITRIALLGTITWIMKLDKHVLFSLPFDPTGVTAKDLVLIVGGLFLIYKSTVEIHAKIEGSEHDPKAKGAVRFWPTIGQILVIDLVFSLDSVITAVGMVKPELFWVMISSVVLAVMVMLVVSGKITRFIQRHPTIKMLALSFLLLIGVMLVAEGLGQHISKGYIYFAMAFSLLVEVLNIAMRSRGSKPNLGSGAGAAPASH